MWTTISDLRVRHVWHCPECGKDEYVEPNYYEALGSPVCAVCDQDMGYVRTEVRDE